MIISHHIVRFLHKIIMITWYVNPQNIKVIYYKINVILNWRKIWRVCMVLLQFSAIYTNETKSFSSIYIYTCSLLGMTDWDYRPDVDVMLFVCISGEQTYIDPFRWNQVGRNLLSMFCMGVFCFTLNMLIEYRFFVKFKWVLDS